MYRSCMRFYLCLILWSFSAFADEITGFWETLDKKTELPSSIVAVYQYQGKYYGKIIGIYDDNQQLIDTIYHPIKRASSLEGDPFYCGLDIVLDVTIREDDSYRGQVMDPRSGKLYRAELWREGANLILRGKLFIFGQNVTWPPFSEHNFTSSFPKPDLSQLVPLHTKAKD